MTKKMCNVRFQIQEDVIEVVTRRYEMAGINVTNKLLELYIKNCLTIHNTGWRWIKGLR